MNMNMWENYIFVEAYTALNLGDDLFLHALFSRYPDTLFLMRGNGKYAEMFNIYKNVKVLDSAVVKALNVLDVKMHITVHSIRNHIASKCRAAVLIGGSLFIEPYLPSFSNKLYQNKPLFIIGANFGPYSTKKYLDYCREYIVGASDACFRDKKSYQLFYATNKCRYAPDIGYSFIKKNRQNNFSGKGLFISVMNFETSYPALAKYQKEYEKFIISIIRKAIAQKQNIKLSSFCEREGDNIEVKKIISAFSELERENIKECYYTGKNIREVIDEIKVSEYVIGTRFHSIVLGLALQKKVLPISYSVKTDEMLNDFGISEYTIQLSQLSECTKIQYGQLSADQVAEIAEQSDTQFKGLDNYLITCKR